MRGRALVVILFGTGWRHRSAPENTLAYIGGAKATVQYVGAQGSFDGLDQMNILLPRSVAGKGKVDLLVTIDGKAANPIDIAVR